MPTSTSTPVSTGTGLDRIVQITVEDTKLAQGTSQQDIQDGAEAMAALNALLIEAIRATGVADDGTFSSDDIVALNKYILANHADAWADLFGDDENGTETGFHLVRGDGNRTLLNGSNAIDKVAASIYSIGFEMIGRSRLADQGGNSMASTSEVASWLNKLLAFDLADGSLHSGKSGVSQTVLTVSNAGEPVPFQDPDFQRYYDDDLDGGDDEVSGSDGADDFVFQFNMMAIPDIAAKHVMANGMIHWGGVAGENANVHDHYVQSGGNDTVLDFNSVEGDTISIVGHTTNLWLSYEDVDGNGQLDTIIHVYSDQGGYKVDANGNFTGSPNGAHDGDSLGTVTVLNSVLHADEIYNDAASHYGAYDTVDQIPEPDNPQPYIQPSDGADVTGTGSQSTSDDDAAPVPQALVSPADPVSAGAATVADTETGLDDLVDIILSDRKLAQGTSQQDIQDGADAAATMNDILVEAIKATGVADDGTFSGEDIAALSKYIVANHADAWADLHGDDENGLETGFHLVRGDGNRTLLYGSNAVDKVADSIYHIGFEMTTRSRLTNEDGKIGESIYKVADWMNRLMEDDLADGSLHSGKSGGSQTVLTVSNAGEPVPFQDPDFQRYYDDDLDGGDDEVSGSDGADEFVFQFNMMAIPDIAAKHVMANGMIHWGGVAGENANVHDHYVQSGGNDTVLDFNAVEGDTISIVGHTTNLWLSYEDVDGNGQLDTIIHVYSDQGGYDVDANGNFTGSPNGAHDGDSLGTVTVLNSVLHADEIYNDAASHYGAYDTVDQIPEPDNPRSYLTPVDTFIF